MNAEDDDDDDDDDDFPLEFDDCTSFANFCMCLTEVKAWLTNNFLQLNEDKTEFIIFGNRKNWLRVMVYCQTTCMVL